MNDIRPPTRKARGEDPGRPDAHAASHEPATRHTAIGVGLNLLLLGMIGYGYWQSERWGWAWAMCAIPIVVVTLRYARHLGDR
jgi:hypothetical protein